MLNNIFDSHAHYNDQKFDINREEILQLLPSKGIDKVINVGANIKESHESIKLAQDYNYIFASIGIHPLNIDNLPTNYISDLDNLSKQNKVVSIGEIGLDYHYKNYNPEKQQNIFKEQLSLASDLNLPVIIHSREADKDLIDILKKFKLRGVIHCFSGSLEISQILINMGFYLGFTGVITFKNNNKHIKILENIPIEKMLIETDCPYMAPEPYRGNICNSTMLLAVIEKISIIKNISPQQVTNTTNLNTCSLFNIK